MFQFLDTDFSRLIPAQLLGMATVRTMIKSWGMVVCIDAEGRKIKESVLTGKDMELIEANKFASI